MTEHAATPVETWLRVQVVEPKVPEPEEENVTVPVGVIRVPDPVSVTVTLHVTGELTVVDDGVQVTVTEVVRRVAL